MTHEYSLIEAENSFILNRPKYSRHRPGFYPSSASVEYMDKGHRVVRGTCLRSGYYQATNEIPEPASIYLNQTAFVGKTIENALIDRWKTMGVYVDNGVKFFDRDVVLSGELDAILKNPVTNSIYGCEVKSYYGYNAEKGLTGVKKERGTGKAYYGKPKDYQFLQSLLYAWEYRDVLPEYRLYYFERGTGERFEFEVGLDRTDPTKPCWWRQIPGANWNMFSPDPVMQPFSVADVHNRYKVLLEKVRNRELPDKDYHHTMQADEIEYRYSIGEMAVGKYNDWVKSPDKKPIKDWHCDYCFHKNKCQQDK
jgi:hypothetical protein